MISLLALFICIWSLAADAAVDETVQLRIFNHNLKIPHSRMVQLVENANLPSYGYKKKMIQEVTTDASDSPTGRPITRNTIYYYKDVPCTRLVDEAVQLDKLLKGVFGPNIETKVRKDVREKKLDKMRKCRTGAEFHFGSNGKCMKRNGSIQKRGKSAWCVCVVCNRIDAEA